MNCMACGGDNRVGAHFCRHCGAPLSKAAVVVPTTAPAMEPSAGVTATEAGAEAAATEAAARSVEPAPTPLPAVAAEATAPEAKTKGTLPEGQAPVAPSPQASTQEGSGAGEIAAEPGLQIPGIPVAVDGEGPAETQPPAEQSEQEQEAEPLVAVPTGSVIANRYIVLEPQEVRVAEILYSARDLRRCWQCDFEGNAPDDAFCAQCGAAMDRRPGVRLLQVRDAQAEPQDGATVAERVTQEGSTFLVLAESRTEQQASSAVKDVRLVIGQRSDVGRARELNEDSLLVLFLVPTFESRPYPALGLLAVADGMGGHEGGEVASKLALQVLAQQVVHSIVLPELAGETISDQDISLRMGQAGVAANDAVYLARHKRENDMGTTLTAAFVCDGRLFLAHVGDSRAYRWNGDGLKQLTTDHSLVASMIATGRAAPEEIYTHPQRNVIYRCIGDRPVVEVDTAIWPLGTGDRLLLCSDGLWEMVRDEGIQDVLMQEADPQAACDLLVKRANAVGGEDNISVIVVQLETM